MSPRKPPSDEEQLAALAVELEADEVALAAKYARRLELMLRMREGGTTRPRLAELARLSKHGIDYVLGSPAAKAAAAKRAEPAA